MARAGKREKAPQPEPSGPARHTHAHSTSTWEWIVGALGLGLVLVVVGYIAYHAVTTANDLPSISVEVTTVEASRSGYMVRFRARNHSGATAAALRIRGELRRGSSVIERSEVTLDYLPSYSERTGGLFFQENPSGHELRVVPEGYSEP